VARAPTGTRTVRAALHRWTTALPGGCSPFLFGFAAQIPAAPAIVMCTSLRLRALLAPRSASAPLGTVLGELARARQRLLCAPPCRVLSARPSTGGRAIPGAEPSPHNVYSHHNKVLNDALVNALDVPAILHLVMAHSPEMNAVNEATALSRLYKAKGRVALVSEALECHEAVQKLLDRVEQRARKDEFESR
jgi:hypothetical protein